MNETTMAKPPSRIFPSRALPGADVTGESMVELVRRGYPLRRSITGDGVRETLRLVDEWAALELTEVPAGTRVFDWTVPPEWNVREAWIANRNGERIVDLASHPLHVVGYSEPVSARLRGAELRERLFSLAEHPDWIPYRTSYYDRTWGFSVTGEQLARIADDDEYDVLIDSTLDADGSLTFGEHVVEGSDPAAGEILVWTYVCHPGMANDNLAGIAVAAAIARWLPPRSLRSSVRVAFGPGTVGALSWLHARADVVSGVRHGLVVYCTGDRGQLTYKRSRRGDADVDRAAALVLGSRPGSTLHDFTPWGSDERQFCSPGFDLPVGCLSRTPHGLYPEYHSSADDLDLVDPASLADSLQAALEILEIVDTNDLVERVDPRGEPFLRRHALEGRMTAGLLQGGEQGQQAIFWVLNLADGRHTLLDIAERSRLPYGLVREAADTLLAAGLLKDAA